MVPQRDLFRDTWVRYLGYTNEVGEALRGVVSRSVVKGSYQVAGVYVVADTATKTWNTFRREPTNPLKLLITAGDVLIWQSLASIIIPGFTINRICALSRNLLEKHSKQLSPQLRSGLTVAVGLASIPIIIRPIDYGTSKYPKNPSKMLVMAGDTLFWQTLASVIIRQQDIVHPRKKCCLECVPVCSVNIVRVVV